MAIDMDDERAAQAGLRRNNSGGWKPEEGEKGSVIRVLTLKHKVTPEDVKLGLFDKAKLGKEVERFDRQVTRQFGLTENNAPVFSTSETVKLWEKKKASEGKEDARDIQPQTKYACNIVDMNNPQGGVITWMMPKSIRKALSDLLIDEDWGPDILGLSGTDLKVFYDPNAAPAQMYRLSPKPGEKARKLASSFQDKVLDFYRPDIYSSFAQEYGGEPVSPSPKNGGGKFGKTKEKIEDPAKDPTDGLFDD